MPFSTFMNQQTLLPAIQSGQVKVATINDTVRRILRKIVAFGFLDRPQLGGQALAEILFGDVNLSYTEFSYSDLKITPSQMSHEEQASVTFCITNIGQRAGAEVAQLYVGEENPRVPRPIKELKGFAKVYLQPGESKPVTIRLNQRALAFYNVQARAWEADPGAYALWVAALFPIACRCAGLSHSCQLASLYRQTPMCITDCLASGSS